MSVRDFGSLLKTAFMESKKDKAQVFGAALSFYTIFSLAPLLIIIIAIVGLFFGTEVAESKIFDQITGLVGEKGGESMHEMLVSARKPMSGILPTIIGIATLFFGASRVFLQLKLALNSIWGVETQKKTGIKGFIKQYLGSFSLVIAIGFLLLVSLVVSATLAALGTFLSESFPGQVALMWVAGLGISFLVLTILFALLFKFLPDASLAWRDVLWGAALTSIMFVIGKYLIGLYLGKSAILSGFGAAASIVVILLWVFYSAQIFLYGAEFTYLLASRRGAKTSRTATHDTMGMPDHGRLQAELNYGT